jgi:undecaprenyl-diphosphatase
VDLSQAVLLALVQGFTEFLPISSSGHLILVPALLGWPDQGLGFAGMLFADDVETVLRSPTVIATTTLVFGVLLWVADRYWRGRREEQSLGWSHALQIGLAQALALIPGTSRSGITMTAGLGLGLTREAAGRFSFLLAVPAIGMAASWQLWEFVSRPAPVMWGFLAIGVAVSAVTAFVTIALFLRLIGRIGMGVFAAYRLALAAVIVLVLL